MNSDTPLWLQQADSPLLADALATLERMGAADSLFDAGAEQRQRFGELGLRGEEFAARHSITKASELAVFATETLDGEAFVPAVRHRRLARALALLYVTRERWGRKVALAFALVLIGIALLLGAQSVNDRRIERSRLYAETTAQRALDAAQADLALAERVLGELQALRVPESVQAPVAQHLAQLTQAIEQQRISLRQVAAGGDLPSAYLHAHATRARREIDAWQLAAARLEAPAPEVAEAFRPAAAQFRARIDQSLRAGDLDGLQAALDAEAAVHALALKMQDRPRVAMLDQAARDAIGAAETEVDLALAEADITRATRAFDAELALKRLVATPYTLRIVDRPRELSGVPRYPVDNPNAPAYYLIVEAIGADGQVLALPVLSEETQQRSTVTKFGLRVSEEAFNRVRGEKQGSGRIADPVVGSKPAGRLQPDYLIAASGGVITEW